MIQLECTDTFAGETNYSYVYRKDDCTSKNLQEALRVFKRELGIKGRHRIVWDSGDVRRIDLRGANVCLIASYAY